MLANPVKSCVTVLTSIPDQSEERHMSDLHKKMSIIWTGAAILLIALSLGTGVGLLFGAVLLGLATNSAGAMIASVFCSVAVSAGIVGLAQLAFNKAESYGNWTRSKERLNFVKKNHGKLIEERFRSLISYQIRNAKERSGLARYHEDLQIFSKLSALTQARIHEVELLSDKIVAELVSEEQKQFDPLVKEVEAQINVQINSFHEDDVNEKLDRLSRRSNEKYMHDLFKELQNLENLRLQIPGLQYRHMREFWGNEFDL